MLKRKLRAPDGTQTLKKKRKLKSLMASSARPRTIPRSSHCSQSSVEGSAQALPKLSRGPLLASCLPRTISKQGAAS